MPVRRSVLKLLMATLALPLIGKGAAASGVGLSFDLTLVSTRVFVEDIYDRTEGTVAPVNAYRDPARLGIGADPGFAFPGLSTGQTAAASFRRDTARDWSLVLPAARFDDGIASLLSLDPLSGLGSYMLSNESRQIDLDFASGTATFTTDRTDVVDLPGSGGWMSYGGVQHNFALSNVMDQGIGATGGAASIFAAATAYSSFGPVSRSRIAPTTPIPLPAALLMAATGIAALAGLRHLARDA